MYSPQLQCTLCSAPAEDGGVEFTRRLRARTELANAASEQRPVDRAVAMATKQLYRIPRLRPIGDNTSWAFSLSTGT